MAELEDRYKDNVAGKYFVDEQCIDCDLCRETGSDQLQAQRRQKGYSYVYKQPETEEEESPVRRSACGLSRGGYWRFRIKDD